MNANKTSTGYSKRVRFGKNQRATFELNVRSDDEADARGTALEEIARMLTEAGLPVPAAHALAVA